MSTTEREIIVKEIEQIRNKYLASAIEIISDYNTENHTKDDYKGRQIYELLQNADDCYSDACLEIKVKFVLEGNKLIIKNTGKPFDSRGIISLMHPNASSKHQGTIGCKGLGFRAVLNWANKVSIHTKNFVVTFSEENAIEQFEYYKKHTNKDHIDELERYDRIAILSSAQVREPQEESVNLLENEYSTAIVLYCRPDCVDAIQKQLTELQFEELLFLKHIKTIFIDSPHANRQIDSVIVDGHFLIEEGEKFTDWFVWKREGSLIQANGEEKDYEIVLAYNNEDAERENIRKHGKLYSYFKTDIGMPLPFLVHGTFELSSERNGLIKDSHNNKLLIDLLVDFIAEKGAELALNHNESNYDALKFILPASSLPILDEQ